MKESTNTELFELSYDIFIKTQELSVSISEFREKFPDIDDRNINTSVRRQSKLD